MIHSDENPLIVARAGRTESVFAIRLCGLLAGMALGAGALATGLSYWIPPRRFAEPTLAIPIAFLFSTALLAVCSGELQVAVNAVRRERQRKFRRALAVALASGTGFVGVQTYGLWCIVESLHGIRNAGEAQLGAATLVFVAAGLHALHVSVALMCLAYVTLRSFSDRYDHEYYFGVSVCAWFWHILGVLWIFILGAYLVASSFLTIRLPPG
jgi:cytochrome c oxidase subunit 3